MIYLYLARRDKRKVDIVTLFDGVCPLTLLPDIKPLQLPWQWEMEINYILQITPNSEIWIESAPTHEIFMDQLTARGYSNVPHSSDPQIWLSHVETDTPDKAALVRKGRKPVSLAADVVARLYHRHKMYKYQKSSPLA